MLLQAKVGETMLFKVKVYRLGTLIKTLVYLTDSAIDACNLAEKFCKQRPLYWYARDEHNKQRLYVKGYNGLTFEARQM
jgi:hypothetical protein